MTAITPTSGPLPISRLYAAPRRPYYIVAPPYRRTSSGIRVLHMLCHALNLIGEEAYVTTSGTQSNLRTPSLTTEIVSHHEALGLNPITIYPEVIAGNPRRSGSVVRYLLNRPGLLGGTADFDPTELIYGYGEQILPGHVDRRNVLFIPHMDLTTFNNKDNPLDSERSGSLLYVGRYHEALTLYPDLVANSTLITHDWPTSHEELAALFRRSAELHCFESTGVALEAAICGCPTIIHPSPYFNGTMVAEKEHGKYGIAYGENLDEIAFAHATAARMWDSYQDAERSFWDSLSRFVSNTQAMPVQELPPLTGESETQSENNKSYFIWRARQTLQEIDAQLLAERMVLKWKTRPDIHLLLALHPGEETLLADTLDSLAAQLYPEWLLTVVTTLPPPEGLGDITNLQWLTLREDIHINYVIDEMAAASPGTWLARIDPGLTLEPQTLQVIADYINLKPHWRLIYCDEDTRETDDRYTQPCFKPDFNLDLLRAQAYFGSLVIVAKQTFLEAGRYGGHAGAENYDLALRVLDHAGEAAIGHISQMLAHLSRKSQRPMQPDAEKTALAAHLARKELNAEVLDGIIVGTRRINYFWPDTPLVSIVIQTRDREEYLRPLLNSIAERTNYPNYEIVVVDNDSSDPDARAFLTALETEAPWAGRARVVACPGEFNYAHGANTGAAAARGNYVLFLDNDTHIVQDEWLGRLVAIAQRPEVGIVGPRMTYPETAKVQQTGWVLGLRGSARSAWDNDADITESGYMGRALCVQNVGAVSGSALLIRKSLFEQLGGMNASDFPIIHGALDLCMRAGEVGQKLVWTPDATLVHHREVSLKPRKRTPEGALADLAASRAATNLLVERWLPRLAHDPAYNRNLSLIEAYKTEHISPIDWDTNFHDRPRILGVPLNGGAGEYRVRAPLRTIGKAGLAQTMICEPPKAFFTRVLSPIEVARAAPDTIILHQPLDDRQTDALDAYARFIPKVRRIITIDDLITAIPTKNPFFKVGFKDARPRLRRNLQLADRVVVSTQPLADVCADMIEDVRVMPNCLEWSLWTDATPLRLPHKRPRVGWAGAQQHLGDLELIYTVVEALATEVDWIFMGMCPAPLKPFVHEYHDFVRDFRTYPRALARLDLDLAIAPLDIHPFNEAKSNLRLLEYGAMGWPVICTDIYPYQNAPVTRLPNEPEKWIKTIREQLAEPDALREAGLTLQAWVHDSFILENHAASWFAAYGP